MPAERFDYHQEEEPIAIIEIQAARHSIKAKTEREQLSPAGMEAAVIAGSQSDHHGALLSDLEAGKVIDVYGSPRERTTQSSILRMLGEHFKDADFSSVDPKELVEWIIESGQINTIEDKMLDFNVGVGEYYDKGTAAFLDKQYLKWLVEMSDRLAIETKQNVDAVETLSTQAANVALFFSSIGTAKASQMVKDGGVKDYVFATSHQGVLESFLYKVILMKEGKEEADEFVVMLGNQGFAENQGFKMRFEMLSNDQWRIIVMYENKEYNLDINDINHIIKEGLDVRQQMNQIEVDE